MNKLNRRHFITAAGLSSYSLYVRADNTIQTGEEVPICTQENCDPVIETPNFSKSGDSRFRGEPHLEIVDLKADLLVAGGGLAGVCAALAAARNGISVILVQDRSVLGGNSSSEVRMHVVGANSHNSRPGWREGGIIEELRLDDAVNNPQRSFEMWSLLLYDKIMREPNIKLLLDTSLYAAETADHKITRVMARCDKSEQLYRIQALYFADCTGDARLALEAGAACMWGHEDKSAFGESLAWDKSSPYTQGSSILFTSRDYGRPMPYTPPSWSRNIQEKDLNFRTPGAWEYGYWWIELGGKGNTIKDNEKLRFELLSVVTGVWNYIKNSGKYPESETWAIDWIGLVPGRRESRRIIGEHVLAQNDLEGGSNSFNDSVCIGGWSMDDHPPGGFDDTDKRPAEQVELPEVYNIPLRSLFSRDLSNLFHGRQKRFLQPCCFFLHQGHGDLRGHGTGRRNRRSPVCTGTNPCRNGWQTLPEAINGLQQTLLKQDQTIKNAVNQDPLDLARKAQVTCLIFPFRFPPG